MNTQTKIISALCIICAIVTVSLWSKPESDPSVIRIGYFAPLTGPAAETSEQMFNAFKLAHADSPYINGRKIEVIYEDDGCDPKKAVIAAQKLIDIDKVDILVAGVCSGSALAVAPVAEANKVVLFTPVSTSPKLTMAGDYVFRISGNSVQVARSVSSEIVSKLGYKKVAILFENAEYTVGWKDAFVSEVESVGGQVLSSEGFSTKDTDVRTQLLKLNGQKPDALIFVANSAVSANTLANQMKQLGITTPVVGNEYFAFKQSLDNPNTDGYYATIYDYDQQNEKLLSMNKRYLDMYGKKPEVEIYVAMTYDGYNILRDVTGACAKGDSNCFKKGLYTTKGYEGTSGGITIDANGDTDRKFVLKKIVNKGLLSF